MVTKTTLGLISAALMMILGTQGVDAQRLRQDQMPRYNGATPTRVKGFKSPFVIEKKNGMDMNTDLGSPMFQGPRRTPGTAVSDVTHEKSWYDAKTYTWYDADSVSHTASYTDEVTDVYQVFDFLKDLYSNPVIPGIQYSGLANELLNYRFPWGMYTDANDVNYFVDLGWPYSYDATTGYGPLYVTPPVENGHTVCLVKVKDSFTDTRNFEMGKEDLLDYMSTCIESVQLLTDGLRVDEGSTQAGTVFAYSGNLNRFFFIGKGKNYETYKSKVYATLSHLDFYKPSGYSSYTTLSSPWSGRIYYTTYTQSGSTYDFFYIQSGRNIVYTVPSGVSNAKVSILVPTWTEGYFKINNLIYYAEGGWCEFDLPGTFSSGQTITISGCTETGANSNSPYMAANGIDLLYPTGEVRDNPAIGYDDSYDDTNPDDVPSKHGGYAPFYDMFEEYSPTTIESGAEITDFYPTLMQGDTYPIEHDCMGVIRLKHFFSMSGNEGTESHSLSNLVIYIPDDRGVEGERNYNEENHNLRPNVGLYVIKLEADIAPDDEQKEHTFDVTVDWTSSLDDITHCEVEQYYELHAYWTDPNTGEEKDSIVYTGTDTHYEYEVPQYMESYTIDYKVKGRPVYPDGVTPPEDFYAWSNVDDVIVPGYNDFFMLNRDHYESDFVIEDETNFYRNYLYTRNLDPGFTPSQIEGGMKHFILYRQSTDEGGQPVPAADLYFETANGKVYYKIEYRDEYQDPNPNLLNNNN